MTSGNEAPLAPAWYKSVLRAGILSTLMLGLFALSPVPTVLQQVQKKGELTVIGVSGPTTFFQQNGNARGFQYELAHRFADDLGVKLVVLQAPDTEAVLRAVRHGQADVAITGITSGDPRLQHLTMGQPYQAVSQQLIGRQGEPMVADVRAIDHGRIAVAAGSSAARSLYAVAALRPNIRVLEMASSNPIALLDMVNTGAADYAVVNSNEFATRRALFPDLAVTTNLSDDGQLAWAFSRQDDTLAHAAQRFFDQMDADGSLDRLASFYGQQPTAPEDDESLRGFQRDVALQLPHYRKVFEQNARRNEMDWRLLAAIAYQESKWQAGAVSPTGVQGIMMLTADTAAEMDIADRSNPSQSIRGGADYYRQILDGIPSSVHDPDRTWMALAAYNMGPAWLDRARQLTALAGDDPNKWLDVSRKLNAMAVDARRDGLPGPQAGQALLYVRKVRRYYDTLLLTSDDASHVAMAGKQAKPVLH